EDLLREATELEKATEKNTGMCLCICINYGSRDEMVRAMRRMYSDVSDPSEIT
ncbi:MAG TPA: isoprenyl transferase, partial [Lachnospiraceae bacterium]|nr:isoprenyl transferase [Lachnospiraceae bacterium]